VESTSVTFLMPSTRNSANRPVSWHFLCLLQVFTPAPSHRTKWPRDYSVEHFIPSEFFPRTKWPRDYSVEHFISSEFFPLTKWPRDYSVEHFIPSEFSPGTIRSSISSRPSSSHGQNVPGTIRSSTLSRPSSPHGQMVPGIIRSSTSSRPSFLLHANGPRDNSVEHCILIRVLFTRKWSQRQFGRAFHSYLSSSYTQMALGIIQSSISFSSEFFLHVNDPRDNSVESLHFI
jgi:hypothetical protein